MKILVCGSRKWIKRAIIDQYLSMFGDENIILIHGAARGVDTMAAEYGAKHGWEIHSHPAQWNRYGLGAGPIRNTEMLEENPELVIAFRCAGRSLGTDHMTAIAHKADIITIVINESGEETFL
jgi:hypothetical protein